MKKEVQQLRKLEEVDDKAEKIRLLVGMMSKIINGVPALKDKLDRMETKIDEIYTKVKV